MAIMMSGTCIVIYKIKQKYKILRKLPKMTIFVNIRMLSACCRKKNHIFIFPSCRRKKSCQIINVE